MEELDAAATATSTSVTVNANEVTFDAKGRATIDNAEANVFIRDTLNSAGAIEIAKPSSRLSDTNIILCGTGNNGYCPKSK